MTASTIFVLLAAAFNPQAERVHTFDFGQFTSLDRCKVGIENAKKVLTSKVSDSVYVCAELDVSDAQVAKIKAFEARQDAEQRDEATTQPPVRKGIEL